MIQGKILSNKDDLTQVFAIRRKVFVEEQGLSETEEFDQMDEYAIHVLVYEEEKNSNNKAKTNRNAIAIGRMTYDGIICEIDRIAVLKEYRNKKYGDFAVRMLLNKAFLAEVHEVFVKVERDSINFYKKIGFRIFNSEDFDHDKHEVAMVIMIQDVKTTCNNHCN